MTMPDLLRQLADAEEAKAQLADKVAALEHELAQLRLLKDAPARMNPNDAARYIGRTAHFLRTDRLSRKPNIPFVREGHRTVMYNRSALDAYVKTAVA